MNFIMVYVFLEIPIWSSMPNSRSHPLVSFNTNPLLNLHRFRLLLLRLFKHNIFLGNILIILYQKLPHIVTHITLHRDFLSSARNLRHTTSRRKPRSELLRNLLELESKGFESLDFGYVFTFVALDALDTDFRGRESFILFGFQGFGFGGFFGGVFGGAFLGIDAEGGGCCCESI